MRPQLWYAYVDGYDLDELEDELLGEFTAFAERFLQASVTVINRREAPHPDDRPGDLPVWDLGVNLEFRSLSRRDVAELRAFLESLSRKTGRSFVIGSWDEVRRISEDLCTVEWTDGTRPAVVEREFEFLVDLARAPGKEDSR